MASGWWPSYAVRLLRRLNEWSCDWERKGCRRIGDADVAGGKIGLLLGQKIEVGVTAGAGVGDGGKIAGKVVGVAAAEEGKGKGELEGHLRGAEEFAVSPGLALNRDLVLRGHGIQK